MRDRDHIQSAEPATGSNPADTARSTREPYGTSGSTGNNESGKSRTGRTSPDEDSDERPEGGRLKRLTGETRGLVDDLKEWVDLKIQLIQLDFEDRVRQAANQAALTAVVIVVGLLAVLFGLIAAGEALGAWFDSRSLGFLALAGILALVAIVIHLAKPRLVDRAEIDDDDKEKRALLPDPSTDVPALPVPDTSGKHEHRNQSQSSDDQR